MQTPEMSLAHGDVSRDIFLTTGDISGPDSGESGPLGMSGPLKQLSGSFIINDVCLFILMNQ